MPQPLQQSSGDILADRRAAMAEAYLADGDAEAAADLLRQAIEIAPRWPAGWFRLGEVLEDRLADATAAADAFRTAAKLDAADVLGAAARLGRLRPDDPDGRMSPAYVAKLFDQYAPRFDGHLTETLAYRGPEIIMDALRTVRAAQGRPLRFSSALDLGCGTGLMARAIHGHVREIDGVDLSPEMARMAQETGLYREVWVGDVVEALFLPSPLAGEGGIASAMTDEGSLGSRLSSDPSSDPRSREGHLLPQGEKEARDLILAADVLCYIKDLTPLLKSVAQAIPAAGLFAFTCQSSDAPGVTLGADMRYHHAPDHLSETAAAAGLAVLHLAPCVTRRDRDADVPGHVVVLGRA
jgi:predicted TPR repeat methyltransferase